MLASSRLRPQGRLKVLFALTSAKRVAALPDIATLTENYPGFEATSWFGMMVPAGTPEPVVVRIPAMPVPESGGSRYLIPVSCRYNNPVDAGTSRAGGKAVSARWVASVKSREIELVKACGFSSSNRL